MAESINILKNPSLQPADDYAFLRGEGLKYIEELGSSLWTDYNEHDPGITILEALCYAITELGYRSGLPMKDLLREKDGKIASSQVLFTARNILTQAPLTINDYRKLLIDINGVHNAWLLPDDYYVNGKIKPAGEIPLFADCKKDLLTYETTPHPVYVSGLYKVLLDLDDDLLAGSLNEGSIQVLNAPAINYKAGEVSFTIILPAWNDAALDAGLLKADKDSITGVTPTITEDAANWQLETGFSFAVSGDATTQTATLNGGVIIDLKPSGRTVTLVDMQDFFTPEFTKEVINLYIYKIQKSKKVVQSAIKKLNENRNLCEDFVSVDTIQDEEIAICCDIDLTPQTDMEEVQAKVFYAIEEFLNPSVTFNLLKDLIDKGRTTDEIFEGPVLEHGFIDTEELEQTTLKQVIHASDIISLIMDIEGVRAVRNFRMTKYDKNGKPVKTQTGKNWCIQITPLHKPLLSETRSKILFYKNQFPYLPGLAEVRDTLRWLRAVHARNKLTGHTDDLPLPGGEYTALDEYTSIDYLFPQAYGIGKAGLPPTANKERTAQAKQLKAYLLFYDQLLGDFFSQLKNAKTLFSTEAVTQSYYGEYIDGITDAEAIYKKDSSDNVLLKTVLNNHDAASTALNDWQRLYETNETFIDRRSRFLDHLMARFSESFNDYVLLMYSLDYETQQETKIDAATIINNKIQFLQSYPQVSYERAKAFNYFPVKEESEPVNFSVDEEKLWDTDNVSGLEKKVSRLGGITNIYRRFLYCFTQANIITTGDTPAKYRFVFTNEDGNSITAEAAYEKQSEAPAAAATFVAFAKEEENYTVQATETGWQLIIKDSEGTLLVSSNEFADEATAENAKDKFISDFNKECDSEGLHLLEHILLRPRNDSFALTPVCLNEDCDFCGEQDPYSFRMSVVLPYWPQHFSNMAFRNYFETLVREEAPAHTTVKVCWLRNTLMRNFETAYKAWLAALANYAEDTATVDDLKEANNNLIQIVFNMHSEYPGATLHDCDESKDVNPVMLGRTILRSSKNE